VIVQGTIDEKQGPCRKGKEKRGQVC
jgi:hypothetical protein